MGAGSGHLIAGVCCDAGEAGAGLGAGLDAGLDAEIDVSADEADPADEASVDDVEEDAGAGAALDVVPSVADEDKVSPALADDDDPPPHAATHALRTAIARRRA
jgi:hypothetical protein